MVHYKPHRTNANRVSSTNNNLSNGSSFYITGVQLEIGNIATPFEHRPIGVELSLCQRYFIKGNAWVGPEWMTQGGNVALPARHNFPVIMNHTPDLTNLGFTSQNGAYTHSPSFNDIYPDGFTFKAVLKAGQSAYTVHGGVIYSADAEL